MLTLALQGDLEKWAENVKFNMLTGLKAAAEEEGRTALEFQRDAIRTAGLGDRVANAQRLQVTPSGNRLAYAPAVYLFSRAAHIIEAFAQAEPLRGHPMMAVPIPDSPAASITISRGQSRTEAVERKYGKMRVVPLKGGGLMLVAQGRADNAGGVRALVKRRDKSTGLITQSPNQRNQVEIPMFWLVPQVRLGHPLPWIETAHKIQNDYRNKVEDNLRRRLTAMSDATAGTSDWRTMPPMMIDDMGRAIPAYTGPKDLWGSARTAWMDANGG